MIPDERNPTTSESDPPLVLVVEDEALIRMNAVDMLEDAGFQTVEAADASSALDMLGRHPEVKVLFTDINMPGPIDGLDLARRVNQRHPHVHLILTSGKVRPSVGEIPSDGTFIAKPYGERAFIDLVRAACKC